MRRPLIFPLIGLMTGIIAGNYFDLSYSYLLASLILILIALFFALRKKWWVLSLSLIGIFAFVTGIFDIQKQHFLIQSDQHIARYINTGKQTVEGIIIDNPVSYPGKNILTVRTLRKIENGAYIPVNGLIRLVIPADLNFSYGDFIRFHSELKKISSFKNPGGFDYERYLNRQGIYATGFIANEAGIILLRENAASYAILKLERFRLYLKKIIYDHAPSPQREIIEAMTIGNQQNIPAETRDNFNKTGTSHILSISGLHIGMVAAAAYFFMIIILKSSEYLMLKFNIIKMAALAAFFLVIIYAAIAGMGVTVVRSALMALVFLIALIAGKQRDIYNTLAVAALIILIISPEALFDISFQLSFMAVLAIIYIVPKFSGITPLQLGMLPRWLRSIFHYLYISVLVCLAATIGTLPLIIFYFNRVSSVTIIANLVAVPLLGTLALALAMFFLLSSFFSPVLAGFFIKLTSFFVWIAVEVINKLAVFSWSSFSFTKPNYLEIIVFYLLLLLLIQFAAVQRRGTNKKSFSQQHPMMLRTALILALIFFIGDTLYLSLKDRFSSTLRITAIDVGQGSAILVRFPGGTNMLIDGGGFADSSFDLGKMVIAPYLYSERISTIDIVVLTHPHPDHLLGLLYILDNFNVREAWSNGIIIDEEYYQTWQNKIREHHIKTVFLSANSPVKKINSVDIAPLWPPQETTIGTNELSYEEINDTSLVLHLKYGQISFLVTGDISSKIEKILVQAGKDLKSDVLFVPHHGSIHSSSTDFLKKVACRYAVISAGKNNNFRHPHLITLERYKNASVQIMRTDQNGAVTMTTDGTKLLPTTFLKLR